MPPHDGFLALSPREVRVYDAAFARMFPTDASSAGAREIGAVHFLDQALAGAYYDHRDTYRQAALAFDAAAQARWGRPFADGTESAQDQLLGDLERGNVAGWTSPPQAPFFALMRQHLLEGLFSDPIYGGNIDKLGWKTLGHPGIWLENSAEEQLQETPVTKGGKIQSLADIGYALGKQKVHFEVPGYDPQRGAAPAAKHADVVLVGVGGVGGMIAPTSGEVFVCGEPLSRLRDHHRARARRRLVGFVFQELALLPGTTLRENVLLPLVPEGGPTPAQRAPLKLAKR